MSKSTKIIITVILILIVLVVIVFAFTNPKKGLNENTTNTANETNNSIENKISQENILEENTVQNKIQNQNISQQDDKVESVTNIVPQGTAYSSDSDTGTTNKKQEAIELVKQKWGEDSTVAFSCDSVTSDGEYIIAVTSLETATVRNYFRVNLKNKTVTIEF